MKISHVEVGHETIGAGRTFVIAEIAGSHSGSLEKIKKLIKAASGSRADAVKVQKFKADKLAVKNYKYYKDLKNLEIEDPLWPEIVDYAQNTNIPILADIFDSRDCDILTDLDVSGFKIHTTDINNLSLIRHVASKKKPIFLAVGASTLNEIEKAVNSVLGYHKKLILMYGFQSYPTPVEEARLSSIHTLMEMFGLNVGFLDHTPGGSIESMSLPLVSVACGASVIEKHITLDREAKDPDYQSALNPDEFERFVSLLRKIEKSLEPFSFELSEKEKDYAKFVKKRIVAKHHIPIGKKIEKNDLDFKRANTGLFLDCLNQVIGRKTRKALNPDDSITYEVFK